MSVLLALAQTVQTLAPGLAQPVPPTAWRCNFQATDGSIKFAMSGITPLFPAGWDPNSSKFVPVVTDHPDAFKRGVSVTPGHASEWFREFQAGGSGAGNAQYNVNLMLRRSHHSIAYITRYVSTGQQIPYEYYAVGMCTAHFAPGEKGQERGR